jgi:hypothetical protein
LFFGSSGLTSVSLPESVTSIGNRAFYGCNALTSINIPESVTVIEEYAFVACFELTSITLPEGLTEIATGTFLNCKGLTTIELPSTIASIGTQAFRLCGELTSITIPEAVTSIGNEAFIDASLLKDVYFDGADPTFGESVFENTADGLTLHVREEYYAAYEALNLGYMLSILDTEEPMNAMYALTASFDHQNNHFILVSRNEDSRLNTFVQYTDAIDNNEWVSLSNEHYLEVTDSEEGTVTRTITNIDPSVHTDRFYRLHSQL